MKRYGRPLLAAVFGVVLAASTPLSAQSLQQQNEDILAELKAIRQLLEKLAGPLGQPPTPPAAAAPQSDRVTLANLTGLALGRPDAPLTMVEFTDLQCPFCRQFHVTSFEQIKKDYIDTGKLRYFSRDFPLEQLHPLAMTAARASRCAAVQSKFWEMRHTILANNDKLNGDSFGVFARDLKMNANTFKTCMADAAKYQPDIQKDMAAGIGAHVTGTPSFVVGRTTPDGVDGALMVGAQPYAAFDAKLKELLAAK